MPKCIVTDAILTSFSSRADRSVGFRGVTPELSPAEHTAIMELHGINVRLLIEPKDLDAKAKVEVKGQFDTKTPSQRLRAVLFILWKEAAKEQGEFESFYKSQMEAIIETIKAKLPDNA